MKNYIRPNVQSESYLTQAYQEQILLETEYIDGDGIAHEAESIYIIPDGSEEVDNEFEGVEDFEMSEDTTEHLEVIEPVAKKIKASCTNIGTTTNTGTIVGTTTNIGTTTVSTITNTGTPTIGTTTNTGTPTVSTITNTETNTVGTTTNTETNTVGTTTNTGTNNIGTTTNTGTTTKDTVVLFQVKDIYLTATSMHSLNENNWLSSNCILAFMKTFSEQNVFVLDHKIATQIFEGLDRNYDHIFGKVI